MQLRITFDNVLIYYALCVHCSIKKVGVCMQDNHGTYICNNYSMYTNYKILNIVYFLTPNSLHVNGLSTVPKCNKPKEITDVPFGTTLHKIHYYIFDLWFEFLSMLWMLRSP